MENLNNFFANLHTGTFNESGMEVATMFQESHVTGKSIVLEGEEAPVLAIEMGSMISKLTAISESTGVSFGEAVTKHEMNMFLKECCDSSLVLFEAASDEKKASMMDQAVEKITAMFEELKRLSANTDAGDAKLRAKANGLLALISWGFSIILQLLPFVNIHIALIIAFINLVNGIYFWIKAFKWFSANREFKKVEGEIKKLEKVLKDLDGDKDKKKIQDKIDTLKITIRG